MCKTLARPAAHLAHLAQLAHLTSIATIAAGCLGSATFAQSASPTSATREVQANAAVESTDAFGAWSRAVSSGSTTCSQTSNIDGSSLEVSGTLHAHWPSSNTASTEYTVHFSVPAGMSYTLSGSMYALVSSFAFSGPGWSTLTLSGPSGTVFSHVIEAFTSTPSFIDLSASGELAPGDYTLQFDAYGQGFGSSLMTSGVTDAQWNITLALEGICGTGGEGSCFVAHETPTCSDANCCGAVCSIDPFCCQVAWDSICASEAAAICIAPCPADLDASGSVDASDLAVMLGAWGNAGPADLDGSGAVDGGDLAVMLGAWGPC
jgi:hypothetical protein